jgi:integration host factor subunit alpha
MVIPEKGCPSCPRCLFQFWCGFSVDNLLDNVVPPCPAAQRLGALSKEYADIIWFYAGSSAILVHPLELFVIFNSGRVFMSLTKADIAQKIADDCGSLKGEAAEVFEKLLDIIKKSLIAGEAVMISGFGKWTVKSKHVRRGRNPQTGESITLDARRVVTWQYSPVLKKAVNKSRSNG